MILVHTVCRLCQSVGLARIQESLDRPAAVSSTVSDVAVHSVENFLAIAVKPLSRCFCILVQTDCLSTIRESIFAIGCIAASGGIAISRNCQFQVTIFSWCLPLRQRNLLAELVHLIQCHNGRTVAPLVVS